MNSIKFSSNYPKLWNQKTAVLLEVRMISKADLNPELIEYDTKNTRGEYYNLPYGNLIRLIFVGNKGIPFSTLRSPNPEKFDYYKRNIGKSFWITITEK